MTSLLQIIAPHFVAGLIYDEYFFVIKTAPIIHYMRGWNVREVMLYCKKKRWAIQDIR